jgi:hypothetical protein
VKLGPVGLDQLFERVTVDGAVRDGAHLNRVDPTRGGNPSRSD